MSTELETLLRSLLYLAGYASMFCLGAKFALRHTPAPKPIAPGVPRDPLLDSIIDDGYTAARVMAVMGVAAEADLLNHDHAVMRNLVIDIRPLHRAGLVMCVHPLPDGRAKVHFVEAR